MKPLAVTTFVVLTSLALGTAFVAPARAADPSPTAQSQLGFAFDHCEKKDPDAYVQSRDLAFKQDASIRTWTGKVRGKIVAETIVRCDKEMPVLRDQHAKEERVRRAYDDVSSAAIADGERATLERYRAARAAFVAANGGSTSLSIGNGDRPIQVAGEIARWDVELPARVAEAEKRGQAEAANRARQQAEYDAKERETKELWAGLRADRLAIAKTRGLPDLPLKSIRTAPRWSYNVAVDVGTATLTTGDGKSAELTKTSWCETTYEFKSDLRSNVSRKGPGCKFVQ